MRAAPETLAAAELVAAVTQRTVSSLTEHALVLYIRKNYPAAFTPGARLVMSISEAPTEPNA